MRAPTALLSVVFFGVAALTQCLTFYLLPLFVPVLTFGLVFVLGVIAATLSIMSFNRDRSWAGATPFFLLVSIVVAWVLLPTRHVSEVVRFLINESIYQKAVDQLQQGKRPSCLESGECIANRDFQGYLIFPYPGLAVGWVGVVYSPTGSIDQKFSGRFSASCNTAPLDKGFYLCGFD